MSVSCKYYDERYAQKVMSEAVLGDLFADHIQEKAERIILLRGKTGDTQKP